MADNGLAFLYAPSDTATPANITPNTSAAANRRPEIPLTPQLLALSPISCCAGTTVSAGQTAAGLGCASSNSCRTGTANLYPTLGTVLMIVSWSPNAFLSFDTAVASDASTTKT